MPSSAVSPYVSCVALVSIGLVACAGHDVARDRVTGAAALPVSSTPNLVLSSDALGHDVPLRVVYPSRRGFYPLVVVAPGSASGDEVYARLTDHWATRGYVVLQLTDPDPDAGGASRRMADVRLVLDSLDQIEQRIPALHRSLDRAHIAIAGHDAGVSTALALASERRDDARIGALVLIDVPARTGKPPASAWLSIAKPTFALTAAANRPAPLAPSSKIGPSPSAALALPSGTPHYQLTVRDLDPCLGNLLCHSTRNESSGPPDYAALTALQDASTAFLDAYLRHQATGAVWLAKADRPDLVNGRGRLTVQ
jgi:hypothetical protein